MLVYLSTLFYYVTVLFVTLKTYKNRIAVVHKLLTLKSFIKTIKIAYNFTQQTMNWLKERL